MGGGVEWDGAAWNFCAFGSRWLKSLFVARAFFLILLSHVPRQGIGEPCHQTFIPRRCSSAALLAAGYAPCQVPAAPGMPAKHRPSVHPLQSWSDLLGSLGPTTYMCCWLRLDAWSPGRIRLTDPLPSLSSRAAAGSWRVSLCCLFI